MARIESYGPCPCGSGLKYKWCCQKVESDMSLIARLYSSGQLETALEAAQEALKRNPEANVLIQWALSMLMELDRVDEGWKLAIDLVAANRGGVHPHSFLIFNSPDREPARGTVARIQDALEKLAANQRAGLQDSLRSAARTLSKQCETPTELKLLEIAAECEGRTTTSKLGIPIVADRSNPLILPVLKAPLNLFEAPERLDMERLAVFNEGLAQFRLHRWRKARSAFQEVLAAAPGPQVIWNLAVCQLLLLNLGPAEQLLKRYVAELDPASAEAVDAEFLRLEIRLPKDDEVVEVVSMTWPIKDREKLLEILRGEDLLVEISNPEDEADGPKALLFCILSKPKVEAESLSLEDWKRLPVSLANIFVTEDEVRLEGVDNGGLNKLVDRFRLLAGATIPPAHPRTRTVVKRPRDEVNTERRFYLGSLPNNQARRRMRVAAGEGLALEEWPRTKLDSLAGKTPQEAADSKDPGLLVTLRAEILRLQFRPTGQESSFAPLRNRLGIEPEPSLPLTHDIGRGSVTQAYPWRLFDIDPRDFSIPELDAYLASANTFRIEKSCFLAYERLLEDPELLDQSTESARAVSLCAGILMDRHEVEAAKALLERTRKCLRPDAEIRFFMLDIEDLRVSMRSESPEIWVPMLEDALTRYMGRTPHGGTLFHFLVTTGLVETAEDPDDPDKRIADTRFLDQMIAHFGRKAQAARSGGPAGSKIWTPGGPEKAGGSVILTPESAASEASGEKSRLILPGR